MDGPDGRLLGRRAARRLALLGRLEIHPGLTDSELDRIENRFGFEFADDHRAFLTFGLPVGMKWPDWRHGDPDETSAALRRPVDGVLSGVEHDEFWYDGWGARPELLAEALSTAAAHLASVPRMLPVYSNRYLPAGRGTYGHPVLSIQQTTVVSYGTDLHDYVHQEFGGLGMDRRDEGWQPRVTVNFWRDLVG